MTCLSSSSSISGGLSSCAPVMCTHSANCAADRRVLQVPFLDCLLTCPLLCNARCTVHGRQGRRHLCRGAEAVSHGAVPQTTEILQSQSIHKVFDVSFVHKFSVQTVRRQSSSHSCSSLHLDTVVHMSVVVQRQMPMVQTSGNCEGPAVAVHLNRWSMSLCAGLAGEVHRRAPHRKAAKAVEMVCLRFFPHFSSSSRSSGVERQFSEPSMVKSSLPSRAPAQFHSQHLST